MLRSIAIVIGRVKPASSCDFVWVLSRQSMADCIAAPLYWEQLGKEGPPVAFLHPNPLDHTGWLYQMAHLSTWFRTVGIDLPGYGKSPVAQRGLTAGDVAAACWQAVDQVTHDPAIVVGLSVGACIVQYMAQQQPKRTLALVLSGTRYRRPAYGSAGRRIERYRNEGIAHRHEHTLDDFSAEFRASDLGQYFANVFTERDERIDLDTILTVQGLPSDPEPDWLFEGIRAPTLIICGSEDANVESARELTEHIQDSEVVIMPGAGHACNMERPWEWDAHFLDFLARRHLFRARRS